MAESLPRQRNDPGGEATPRLFTRRMLGLYLHIPFCRNKCPYCDFFSGPASSAQLRAYPAQLQRHLDWAGKHSWHGPVATIYFGGGTPSLLPPRAVGSLLAAVAQDFDLSSEAEITLEANPGTVTPKSLAGYRAAGVNRLSLGLQSLDPGQLATLGRLHGRAEGEQAVHWARQAGFTNLSLDLIFALPGQSLTSLGEEINRYLELAPEHLSCYGLTAEPGTPFQQRLQAGALTLPDGDFYAEAFLLLHERLSAAGYEHYEIANYARHGYACRHNLGYWERRPYLGVGAGAHSFRDEGWGERWAVPPDLNRYCRLVRQGQQPAELLESFDRRGAMSEALYLGLRTASGIDDAAFRARFGGSVAEAFPEAVIALRPWLALTEGHWRMKVDGWLLYDRLIQTFL